MELFYICLKHNKLVFYIRITVIYFFVVHSNIHIGTYTYMYMETGNLQDNSDKDDNEDAPAPATDNNDYEYGSHEGAF